MIFLVPPSISGTAKPESITAYVAMTAVLISGTFLFMTFRVDRNATNEARTTVLAAVEGATRDAIDAARSQAENTAHTAVQNRLSEIVSRVLLSNLETLRNEVSQAVGGLLPTLVDNSATEYMDQHLGEEIRDALQSEDGLAHVATAVRDAVAERLAEAVRSQLPSQLDGSLPPLVDARLPDAVAERLTDEAVRQIVESALDELKQEVSRLVDDTLPRLVGEQLPREVEEYLSTHRPALWRRRS
ncbi:MAG: hypothetical protein OXG82_15070 [Gammaproteobacteria bacterium]|nr:hypothetical protein [Gammaproteobacteria bacterium]